MIDLTALRKIGLTQGEAKVYVALLGLGQTTTGPIVKKSGVTTSKSYKILARLEEKGLVSHVYKNKVKHFNAADPKRVLDLLDQQEKEITKRKLEMQDLIPQLLAFQTEAKNHHDAEIYQGLAGLQTLFNEQLNILKKGEPHYVIGITDYGKYSLPIANFFRHLQKERDHKGIVSNFLLSENARGSFDYMQNCNIRYIPYASLVAVNVYKDITIIGIYVSDPILMKITSKQVADNFINYFNLFWKQAKK